MPRMFRAMLFTVLDAREYVENMWRIWARYEFDFIGYRKTETHSVIDSISCSCILKITTQLQVMVFDPPTVRTVYDSWGTGTNCHDIEHDILNHQGES